MSDRANKHTPTTDDVRFNHQNAAWGIDFEGRGEEFDRWLASVKAEAWDERHKMDPCVIGVAKNPYREEPK